jgi:hypothetical protein
MNIDKSKERIKKYAEVYTKPELTHEMLSHLPEESWQPNKTFLDPSCGEGYMLICVLYRKIAKGHSPITALSTIYGTDIMLDSVMVCRLRMMRALELCGIVPDIEHAAILCRNIKYLDTSIYPQGSLDYDYEFTEDLFCDKEKEELLKQYRIHSNSIVLPDHWNNADARIVL